MLKRLQVDNYRTLCDFDFQPGPVCLLVGSNGSGKTTVLELLDAIRQLVVDDVTASDAFPATTRTRWRDDQTQKFQLTLSDDNGSNYTYRLHVAHDGEASRARVAHEFLVVDDKVLFDAKGKSATLYHENDPFEKKLLTNGSRSGIASLAIDASTWRIGRFRELVSHWTLARMVPSRMGSRADTTRPHPLPDFSNFASWYRHEIHLHSELTTPLFSDLQRVIPGFERLWLEPFPDNVHELRVELSLRSGRRSYRFSELSDGQRALIALYTILHFVVPRHGIAMLDEPDNFVAAAELQPWLVQLSDSIRTLGSQALIVSHHPEIVDYLTADGAMLFERDEDGTTTARPWQFDASTGIKASEALARGWLDG